MEENSETPMETDVSSTTSNAPNTREVTELYENVETLIFVEEVKEEDISNNDTPNSSPFKTVVSLKAALTSNLSPNNHQAQPITAHPDKESHLVNNEQKSQKKLNDVICTQVGIEHGQKALNNLEHVLKTSKTEEQVQTTPIKLMQVQRGPIKLVRMYRNTSKVELKNAPNKSELVPQPQPKSAQSETTLPKLDHVQKTIVVEQVPKKSDPMQTSTVVEQPPKESDQVQKTPSVGEQVPKKSDQVQKSSSMVDQVSQKSDHMQKTSSVAVQVPKKSNQVQKTPSIVEQVPNKSDQTKKIPSMLDQVPNQVLRKANHVQETSSVVEQLSKKSDQVQKAPSVEEQVPKTLEQVQVSSSMVVQVPKKSDPMQNTSSMVEQVSKKSNQMQETLCEGEHLPKKSDQMIKLPTRSEITQILTTKDLPKIPLKPKESQNTSMLEVQEKLDQAIKSLEVEKSKNVTGIKNIVNPTKVTKVFLEKTTEELLQKEQLEQELSKESPKKSDLVHKSQSNKSDKTPFKGPEDNQNLMNVDCSATANQIKEPFDKSKSNKNDDKKVVKTTVDVCDKSNDSQLETGSDVSEKEHNKSISRELKSLIKSAKESKIISECTQLTSKTRKSRTTTDSTNTSLNTPLEVEKISLRRSSINSQKSNSSEKSEKAPTKRSMRSQNPEFVHKVKQFLNSVTGKNQKDDENELDDSRKETQNSENTSPLPKKKKVMETPEGAQEQTDKLGSDLYCWRCHWAVEQASNDKGHPPLLCTVCPRSFHYKCLSGTERNKTMNEKSWICPECLVVLHAESSETRSPAMKKISLGLLCDLLQHALQRMMDLNGVEPFMHPVDRTAFPDYDKYIVHPMDLSLMKKNITEGLYGSTEAFLADAHWILHNSIIFNTLQSKLTGGARALVRSCRAEMGEIEACPECYAAAHARRPTWFTDVCSTPHILLWAKLKGFPYWPAKGMSVNSQGLVDVRFFGAHDRAWVPARDCFLFCEKDPNNFKAKRQDILESMQEAENHISNISRKYGKFVYPAFKTTFDPTKLTEQLKMMIPSFDGEVRTHVKEKLISSSPSNVKDKRRSKSKTRSKSKCSVIDSDMSENEEAQTIPARKMADGIEIAQEKDDFSIDKNTPMEVDNEQYAKNKETLQERPSRKRRRSGLEEAVITIITTSSTTEKRKKTELVKEDNIEKTKDDKKTGNVEENKQKTEENEPNKNNKTVEKASTKINETKNPTTPTITIEVDKEVPIIKTIATSTPIKATIVSSTPIKTTPKVRPNKSNTPKEKEEKVMTPKQKHEKLDQTFTTEKEKRDDSLNSQKRKSRNKSLNRSQTTEVAAKSDKARAKSVEARVKSVEKKSEKDNLTNNTKDKPVEKLNISLRNNVSETEKPVDTASKTNTNAIDNLKTVDRIIFDDDTSLAVIARESSKKTISCLPTISSVMSLSTSAQSNSTITKTTTAPKTIEITVPANVFTPTSTENVRNMKEAVNKLQKLKNDTVISKPLVGRVGVRSFARMTSPPAPPEKQKGKHSETIEVAVKSEPVDFDDTDRPIEKIDLMKCFQLRPVNPITAANLRDVRINKVVVAPVNRKAVTKTTEVRIRARKTFPTPRKDVNDGRSELNGKNSMVYIPIQPPTTHAPTQRSTRPLTVNGTANTQTVRTQVPVSTPSTVNMHTIPLATSLPVSTSLATVTAKPTNTVATNSHTNAICMPNVGPSICSVPTVGQVPNTVHTVPLITSVNGQWTFSLQPMMSLGCDGPASPPTVNGLSERNPAFIPIASSNPLALLPTTQLLSNNSTITSCSTSNVASGETTPAELPRLQQRPPLVNPLDSNAPVGAVPVPSTAGPLTAKLSQNAVKLADFFRNLLEDSLEKIDDPEAQVTVVKAQLEQAKWKHQQEVNELKHTHELLTTEMRVAYEKEKTRAISEMRRVAQVELEAAVKSAKTKQWCANCSQEAQFYCCWNTSYCDYSCQRSHWSQHFAVCTQARNSDNNTNENGNSLPKRLQPGPENLPKNAPAPTLTVGTKITPTRVYSQPQDTGGHPQKTSIIVSMVEDSSGNPMVKCVGTYKPPGTQQVSPMLLNKQMISDENTTKKVMTSGGYLIVGASNSATPIATTRRNAPQPVQYAYNTIQTSTTSL